MPVSDFTQYDHVLDTAVSFNWIPKRFRHLTDATDTYFAIARGIKDAVSSEMTKWFNTNYHYIVPEYDESIEFRLTRNKQLEDYRRIKQEYGVETKPVIVGPYTFVTLAKGYEPSEAKAIQKRLVPLYVQLLKELEEEGVKWVQIDEPALVTASSEDVRGAKELFESITSELSSLNVLLQTYFDSVDAYEELISYPVQGIGLDFVHDKGRNLEQLKHMASRQIKCWQPALSTDATFGKRTLKSVSMPFLIFSALQKLMNCGFSLPAACCMFQ